MVDMVAACKAVSLQPKHPRQIAVSDGRPIVLSIELPLAAPQISLYKNEYTEMMAWLFLGRASGISSAHLSFGAGPIAKEHPRPALQGSRVARLEPQHVRDTEQQAE